MTTIEAPPESKLATALAAFQAELPRIGRDNTANVRSDKGSYQYRYADLGDISPEVLPLLAKHGLSWTCRPTIHHDGRFVLRYALLHASGETLEGDWPLPNPASSSQVLGSAVTYARRYCLCAVTGIAPGDDDDDAAAAQAAHQRAAERPQNNPGSQHPTPNGNGRQGAAQPAAEGDNGQAAALALLKQTCEQNGWSRDRVSRIWEETHDGAPITAGSMQEIAQFRKYLFSLSDRELKEEESRA